MKKFFPIFLVLVTVVSVLLTSCEMTNAIFATPTSTPTNTPTVTPSPTITPSPTPTDTPTPTPTFTPSPTPLPTGVSTEVLEDGSTVFIDYDNKYKFTLPAGWKVIPINLDDLSATLDELAAENPELANTAEAFKSLDPELVRAVALNEDPQYIYSGFATNITVVALQEPLLAAMPVAFVTGALEENFTQSGAKVLTQGANLIDSADGVEVGIIEVEQVLPTASGTKVTVRMKYLVFQANEKLIMVQVATHQQFSDEMFQMMDKVGDSISLLK